MIQKLNLVVRMDDAYRNFGCVTSITIAVMILMNQRTCVVKETVQLAGRDVLDSQIIVAFPSGFSVMEKTIVVTTAMSCQKTVPSANPKLTSSVRTIVAFPSNGLAILLMIVVTVLMNPKHSAKESIANVPNLNSVAITESAFQVDGDVVSFELEYYIQNFFFTIFKIYFRSRR